MMGGRSLGKEVEMDCHDGLFVVDSLRMSE